MTLLAGVIPGLRAIRAPLIAGYLWLLVAWLHFDPSPGLQDETGVVGEIVDLADTVGPVATAAGVTTGAYLLGSLSVGLFGRVSNVLRNIWSAGVAYYVMIGERRAPPRLERRGSPEQPDSEPTRPGPTRQTLSNVAFILMPSVFSDVAVERRARKRQETALARLGELWQEAWDRRLEEGRSRVSRDRPSPPSRDKEVRELLDRALPSRYPKVPEIRDNLARVWTKMDWGEHRETANSIRALRREMKYELKLPATVLVGEQAGEGVFSEADRFRAEAEFRFAIGPPLVALIWQLATETTAWCWALLIVPYLLYSQGKGYARFSAYLIYQARLRREIASPALEGFQRRVNELVAAHERDSAVERAPDIPVGVQD